MCTSKKSPFLYIILCNMYQKTYFVLIFTNKALILQPILFGYVSYAYLKRYLFYHIYYFFSTHTFVVVNAVSLYLWQFYFRKLLNNYKRKKPPKILNFREFCVLFEIVINYLFENCGARLAALRPYFFLSFIRGSLVKKPAFLSAGL